MSPRFFAQKRWLLVNGSLLLSLLILPPLLLAQNRDDYQIYVNNAQRSATIYRGVLPVAYDNKLPNDGSTYYAFSDRFLKGSVLFRGKWYKDLFLNFDANMDELCIADLDHGLFVVVNKHFVEQFSTENYTFVHYKQEAPSLLGDGYYQVLYEGNLKLYKKIKKQYYQLTSYGLEIKKGYTLLEHFFVWKDDRWHRIGTIGDLKKLFADQKRTIDTVVKTKGLHFRTHKELTLTELLTHLDNL